MVVRGFSLMSIKVVFLIFIFLSAIAKAEAVDVNNRDEKTVVDSKNNTDKMPVVSDENQDGTRNSGFEKSANNLMDNSDIRREAPFMASSPRQLAASEFPTSQAMISEQQAGNWGFNSNSPVVHLGNEGISGDKQNYKNPGFSYKNIVEDVRVGLGEDVYGKLTWMYYDIKELDAWIYENVMSYESGESNLMGEFWQFIGVDAQVNAMIIFGGGQAFAGDAAGFQHGVSQRRGSESHSKVVLNLSSQNPVNIDVVENGYFKFVMKYLTIKNVIYFLLSILGAGLIFRIFRFFVKQDLS